MKAAFRLIPAESRRLNAKAVVEKESHRCPASRVHVRLVRTGVSLPGKNRRNFLPGSPISEIFYI